MNKALREHLTSNAFSLSLGKTHVEALVELDLVSGADGAWVSLGPFGNTYARQGLIWRGLVSQRRVRRDLLWRLTDAGRLVVALLHEAGMYSAWAKARERNAAAIRELYNHEVAA